MDATAAAAAAAPGPPQSLLFGQCQVEHGLIQLTVLS